MEIIQSILIMTYNLSLTRQSTTVLSIKDTPSKLHDTFNISIKDKLHMLSLQDHGDKEIIKTAWQLSNHKYSITNIIPLMQCIGYPIKLSDNMAINSFFQVISSNLC